MLSWSELNLKPDHETLRGFGRAGFLFCGVSAIVAFLYRPDTGWTVSMFAGALLFGGLSVLAPSSLRPLYLLLIVVGYPIGWLVTTLALLAFFYGLVTPLALLLRLVGHDPLRRSTRPGERTYWEKKRRDRSPKSYLRTY